MDINWKTQHCGLMLCDLKTTKQLMPDILPILKNLFRLESPVWDQYYIDVKVHMLMPGQFPCIPNWHRDYNPRENGKLIPNWIADENDPKMFLWISGAPITEWLQDGKIVKHKPKTWISFGRNDIHRGTMTEKACWRAFIRVVPKVFVTPDMITNTIRRHSQVYLDVTNFTW